MLDAILNNVKGQVISTLAEKTGLNPSQAQDTIPLAKSSVTEGITSAISGGNVDGILGMLRSATGGAGGGELMGNAVYQGIAGNFIGKLTGSLGLDQGIAGKVSSIALPMIMSKIGGATKQEGESDGINAGSLMKVMGMDAGGLLGKAGGLLGGNKSDDAKGGGLLGGLGGMLK